MTFSEINDLLASIKLSTYICSSCGRIIWPRFTLNDDGTILFTQESKSHIVRSTIMQGNICPACAKALEGK